MKIHRIVIGGVLLTVGLAACGDDDATSTPASTERSEAPAVDAVEVVATDLAFDEDAYAADAGEVAITYRNHGAIPHTLVIEGVDGFKLDVPTKDAVDEGTADLEAGDYVLYCDVPGHRQAGMEATLRVS